jgi:adenylate kinase family enzyme
MNKIIVVGTTGSGKSTFCKSLNSKLDYKYFQLDQLYWKPNWCGSTDDEFFPKIEAIIKQNEKWIIDGNYGRSMGITWPKADTVIWIDYPFWLVFYQNFSRAIKRSVTREELWPNTGNRESILRMFSKDSILRWLIKTYPTMKVRYSNAILDSNNSHINFHRLRSRKEVKKFIDFCGK